MIFYKLCPKCGKEQSYSTRKGWKRAIKRNKICCSCARRFCEHGPHKKHKPKPPVSETSKEKMRLARLNFIKKHFGGPSFNPKACEFIDKLNSQSGWNLKHALNGGEEWICGYSIDGFDSEKKIVFEYDEKHHYISDGNLRQKDIEKQNNIVNRIHPTLFVRYDEKRNKLYDSITGNDIVLNKKTPIKC